MTFRFLDFELDEMRRELRLRGREIVLEPLVFDALAYFARQRGRVVSKDELLECLWPGTHVTESSLQRVVSLARNALRAGGAADAIKTFPRRGYRFDAEVLSDVADRADSALPDTAPSGPAAATPGVDRAALAPARSAYECDNWEEALALFDDADRASGLLSADLERAAWCRLNLGRPADAVPFLERAASAHAAAGDAVGSARAALYLAQIHLEGRRLSVSRGWLSRATRLLGSAPPCREVAQREWIAGRLALADGDLEGALHHAERALELAREIGDVDLEAVALIYLGHVCVARGEVRRGLALHDEAAAAVLGGPVGPWFAGLVYCGLIYICQNRGDWARAAHWTEGFTRWSSRAPTATYPAVCRMHRAEVLSIRGELTAAENELLEVRREVESSAPWAVGDAERLIGDVLRLRGDVDGAEEAYRRARANGWDPCPGWAELLLERGDATGAVRALERALDDPSWSCRQRRRLLTAALARAAALAGDPQRAQAALAAAESIQAADGAGVENGEITPAQRGAIERARAELALAEGRREEAIRVLRSLARFWQDLDCPLESAPVRVRLAELLAAAGDGESARLELGTAHALWRTAGADLRARACLREGE
ncbi:MAG: winged helix-turn-helix domain-containing protein [Acidobacteria bacterium]|nr:winged helix-turn-helix domain-containing protein [Acidobacteriota bacterium]